METRSRRRSSHYQAVEAASSGSKAATAAATSSKSPSSGKCSTASTTPPFHYEFGGPLGTIINTFVLPLVILLLYDLCNKEYCWTSVSAVGVAGAWEVIKTKSSSLWSLELLTKEGCYIFFGWVVLQVVLERLLPGKDVEGVTLKNGKRLSYRMNGHLALWVSVLLMGHSVPVFHEDADGSLKGFKGLAPLPLSMIYDHYLEVAAVAIIFTYALALLLFFASFRPGDHELAGPGSSGVWPYDFWMGRELNPRIGSFDFKLFCELRPGIIGWGMINLGMACKQVELHGRLSPAMILVNIFQGFYVWDAVFKEDGLLTTMDITTDGFGFMLVFGDIAWVPFTYSLQARYLVDHDPGLPAWAYGAIFALHWVGFFIFRRSNSQKDAFRRDPNGPSVRHLKWMATKRGTRLLTSGWWGMARKINYTGDWIMGLCWCLCTGFNTPITYFYAIYFAALLITRATRDDHACALKYGADWAVYKKAVPYCFIPGVI